MVSGVSPSIVLSVTFTGVEKWEPLKIVSISYAVSRVDFKSLKYEPGKRSSQHLMSNVESLLY